MIPENIQISENDITNTLVLESIKLEELLKRWNVLNTNTVICFEIDNIFIQKPIKNNQLTTVLIGNVVLKDKSTRCIAYLLTDRTPTNTLNVIQKPGRTFFVANTLNTFSPENDNRLMLYGVLLNPDIKRKNKHSKTTWDVFIE